MKKLLISITAITLFLTTLSCDYVKKAQQEKKSVSKITLSNSSKSKNLSKTLIDPDLDLSIEELRKKYPIDWLKERFGNQNQEFCKLEGAFPVHLKWPCGPFCDKYPEIKDCPVRCYTKNKIPDIADNLICSFSGNKLVKIRNRYKHLNQPLIKLKDFSIAEIKSAFLEYNYMNNGYKQKIAREVISQDSRPLDIIEMVFKYFLDTPQELLSNEEKRLKSFVFSKKINPYLSDDCIFIEHLINPLSPKSERGKKLCPKFIN